MGKPSICVKATWMGAKSRKLGEFERGNLLGANILMESFLQRQS
jgi:hypothetical protein